MRWIRNASTLTLSPRTGWRATVQHAQHSAGRATSARDGESRPAKRLSRYPGENRDRETRARHVTWGHYGVTRLRTALSARRDGPAHAPRVHRTARTRDTTQRERCELRREDIHTQRAIDGGDHPGPALTRQSQCRTTHGTCREPTDQLPRHKRYGAITHCADTPTHRTRRTIRSQEGCEGRADALCVSLPLRESSIPGTQKAVK